MNRRILVIATVFLVAAATFALAAEKKLKKSEVPSVVLEAVSAKYPKAEMTGFSQEDEEGKTEYEVKLNTATGRVDVTVSPEGKLLEEEQTIEAKDLPEAVRKGLAGSVYSKAKVLRIEKVTEGRKPEAPVFEFLVQDAGKKNEIVFSLSGELIKDEAKNKGSRD